MTPLILARMCREGQTHPPRAIIITDRNFPGDAAPFHIKERRAFEETIFRAPFRNINPDLVQHAWDCVKSLQGEEKAFKEFVRRDKQFKAERKRALEEQRRKKKERAARAAEASQHTKEGTAEFPLVV